MKYFINPVIDALPSASPEERPEMIRRLAACIGDEAALRAILGIDPEEFARFYPDLLNPEVSTEEAISTFISTFSSPKDAETPEIEKLVPEDATPLFTAPAVDYASLIDDDEPAGDAPADETSDLISSFLQAVPPKTPTRRKGRAETTPVATPADAGQHAAEPVAEPSLSEELLKMMVKNKNYAKALEIIDELSLNNPKKSVYFAYQSRFLKKLMKNQEKSGQ